MKNMFKNLGAALLLTGFVAADAQATSITLTTDNSMYSMADGQAIVYVSLDVTPGDGILSGGFDTFITDLAGAWEYAGFTWNSAFLGPVADPSFSRAPDDCAATPAATGCGDNNPFPGYTSELNGLSFGNLNGITGSHLVGWFTFDILGMGVAALTMLDNDAPAGEWYSSVTLQPLTMEYFGPKIFIPLPAAVWLMLGGLGMLLGIGKKRW